MPNKEKENTVVGNAIREAGHKIDALGEKAGDKSDVLIHKGEEVVGNVQKEFEQYTETLSQYIKKNPLKSALIAGGIGLLLGRLLKD